MKIRDKVYKKQLMKGCSIIKEGKLSNKIIKEMLEAKMFTRVCKHLKEMSSIGSGRRWQIILDSCQALGMECLSMVETVHHSSHHQMQDHHLEGKEILILLKLEDLVFHLQITLKGQRLEV